MTDSPFDDAKRITGGHFSNEPEFARAAQNVARALLAGEAEAREVAEAIMLRHDADMQMTEETGDALLDDIAAAITAARAAEREACARIAANPYSNETCCEREGNRIGKRIRARNTP